MISSTKRFRLVIVLFAVGSAVAAPFKAAALQDRSSEALAAVEQSLEEGDVDGATALVQEILASEGESPAAYYQIARIYFEHKLLRDADRAIDRALDEEPSNVDFMEMKLRIGFPHAFPIFIQRTNKVELAEKILEIDPGNAYAHSVLGLEYEELYESNRFRVRVPTAQLFQTGGEVYDPNTPPDPVCKKDPKTDADIVWNMGSCLNRDRFDLEMLKDMGVAVVESSSYAPIAHEKALFHLSRSFESASDVGVGESLLRLYLEEDKIQSARLILSRLYSLNSNTPAYWLYSGLVEYVAQNFEKAREFFDQGVARMDPALQADFEDPSRIQSPVRVPLKAGEYWSSRDIRFLTSFNERHLEHYARMAHAALHFGAGDSETLGWETARGRLFVRYGKPYRMYTLTENEETVREIDDRGKEYDESASTRGDHHQRGMNLFQIWEYGDFRFVFQDPYRTGSYELWAVKSWSNAWYKDMDFVTLEKDRAIDTTERSTIAEELPRVEFPYLVSVFKGADARADLVVPYGVPMGQDEAPGRRALPINGGIFLIDSEAGPVAESRTDAGVGAEGTVYAFDQSVVWTNVLELQGEAGTLDVSVEWETADGSSMGFHRSAVVIPEFSGGDLTVSDLMLAYRVEEADPGMAAGSEGRPGPGITRNDLFIEPAPWGVFSTEQPVYVYFEAYGLGVRPDGSTRYDIEAELIGQDERGRLGKLFGGQNPSAVSVRFEDSGREKDIGRYLILDSTDQPPGTYQLVVRIHDAVSGSNVQAERTVILE